ncbi:MAG: RNA polymerase sigma-70 factor [Marinifilaceae bacterium]
MYSIKRNQFNEIFNIYYPQMVAYAVYIIGDKDDAEDIVQTIFVKLWEENKVTNIDNIKNYLFSAVHKRSINYLQHLKVRNKHQEDVINNSSTSKNAVWQEFIEQELFQRINSIVDTLSPKTADIFKARFIDELSSDEIAVKYNISKRTAEKHYENAIKRIRSALSQYATLLMWFK